MPSTRPERLVLVAGTATEVGKTWVGAQLLHQLRESGTTVAARKPVQSFDPESHEPTDAEVLAKATGETTDVVCPPDRSYATPMAPPMAAAVLGRHAVGIDELAASVAWPPAITVGLVESVGGVRSPIAGDGDTIDLARRLAPDVVVLVADAGLGTINAVRLCAAALDAWPTVVFLNRFRPGDDLHQRNREWLTDRDGFAVIADIDDLVARLDPTNDPTRTAR